MKLKQIVISIENSPGRLLEVADALGKAGINLRALNLVDTGAFGQLRLLVSDVARHILFAGGKRLRPLLLVLSARLCGYDEAYANMVYLDQIHRPNQAMFGGKIHYRILLILPNQAANRVHQ